MQTKANSWISRNKLKYYSSHKASFVIGLFVVCAILSSLLIARFSSPTAQAAAGINEQLNYQARLLDSSGAVVADGTYNMEFKIYQDGTGCVSGGTPPCSGTLKWTETRTSTNKVTVKNGYFSVNLGSVTAFGTSVDWNQDTLWLSINIGGTGTPTWDGEMTPFRRLAAVPYAMNAKQLGGLDASKFVQLAPSAVQVDSGTLSSIFVNKTGASGNILQLQKNGGDLLNLGYSGILNLTPDSGTTGLQITTGGVGVGSIVLGTGAGYFQKTLGGEDDNVFVVSPPASTGVATTKRGGLFLLGTSYWNGSSSVTEYMQLQAIHNSTTAGDYYLSMRGGIKVTPQYAGTKGILIQGAPSQTANLFEITDSTPTTLYAFAPSGASTQTYNSTSATAGNEYTQTINVTDTGAVTTGTDETRGVSVSLTHTGASGTAVVNTVGGYFQATGDTGGTSTVYGVEALAGGGDINYGFYGGAISVASNSVSSLTGVSAGVNSLFSTSSSATDVQGLKVNVGIDGGVATFTNARGILVTSATNSSGGTITNNYGIHIETQTAGASNYGLRVDTATTQTVWIAGNDASATTSAKGIAFGSAKDATLYRGGANILQTDGDLYFKKETNHTIKLADSTTNNTNGSTLTISGANGSSGGTSSTGGAIAITAGNAGVGDTNGGAVTITGGASSGFGTGGAITILGGGGWFGAPVNIDGGNAVTKGNVYLQQYGGLLGIGFGSGTPAAKVEIRTAADATLGLIIKGNSGTQSANLQEWQTSGGTPLGSIGATGAVLFQNSTNSATAFQIKDSGGGVLFKTDTATRSGSGGNLIKIGDSTGTDGATTILQVDAATANPTSNLSALNGGIFYNSTSNKMSIIENGAVKVLCNTTDAGCGAGGATTLQSAYAATSGNTIVATDGRDLAFTFPDTTTDPNFTINLQCVTSCSTNGRFAVQSAGTDVFTISPSGTITATKHVSLGASGSVQTGTVLYNQETYTGTGGFKGQENQIYINSSVNSGGIAIATDSNLTLQGSGISYTGSNYAVTGTLNIDATGASTNVVIGVQGGVNNRSTGTIANAYGAGGIVYNTSTGTITNAFGVSGGIANTSTGTITTAYNLYIGSLTNAGTVGTNYGGYFATQTSGTANYGVRIDTASTQTLWISGNADSTAASAGIAFGTSKDTNLYRDAANSLKTDDKFTAVGLVTTDANTVQFNDSDNSNYVALKAASTVSSNVTWTLPSADSAGCLQSDGSGTLSIAACGDTNIQTFSSSGDYTVPTNALMVIVEGWGGGGGGGGGTGGTTAAVRSGGAGGGGGGYNSTIITASSLGTAGTVVKVTVGAGGTGGNAGNGAVGGDGGAGGTTCFSTTTSCAGTMYFRVFGGGGGNGNGTAGNGGGGGGGSLSVGTTNGTAATGGTGGSPLGASAGAQNSGYGGAGGATAAATGAAGGSSGYGGGGGGSSSSTGAGNSGAGGGSAQGGAAGGAGATCAITTCTQRSGGAGGSVPNTSGGGGTAGTTAGQAGGNGAAGVGSGGDGGGGGANNAAGTGGAGGTGGARGGGGGGGGAGETTLGGAGGAGGAGYLRTWTLRGAGADLAEMYNTYDDDMIAGDVVAIDGSLQSGVKKTERGYDPNTIGVISTRPGLILGDETNGQGAKTVMVALAGRVPVKVSLENGPINAGDPLTPSSTPGVAMKATKYGPIIGNAMTAYAGDGPGYVVVFIKNSHTNGSKLSDALQSTSAKYQDPSKTLAQNALTFFSEEGKVKTDSTNISEVYTDRVAAALEIISPQVTTNNLATDTITPTTGKDVSVNLQQSGKIAINDNNKEEVASIDDKGNATFKGTITADKIRANQIEGLEVLTNQLSSLAQAEQSASQSSTGTTTQQTSTQSISVNIKDISATTAIFTSDVTANGTLFANGALKVAGPAEFLGDSIFYKLATFIDKTIFKNNVEFAAPATFGDKIIVTNNTAGTVKIPVGETKIVVQFSKPYSTPPVINATPIGIIAPKYGVTNITKSGFEIDIDPAQPTETQFNWFAVEAQP